MTTPLNSVVPFPRYYVWQNYPNGFDSWRCIGMLTGYATRKEAKAEIDMILDSHDRANRGEGYPAFKMVITKAVPLKKVYGG